ncbi:hypothetical protein, partial [Shewanella glacialipiscicola]
VIRDLADEKETKRLSLGDIYRKMDIETTQFNNLLDELKEDGFLIDHSNNTLSWERSIGADGIISQSFTRCVELVG